MMGFAVGVGGELVGGCVYGVDLLVKWLGLRVVVLGIVFGDVGECVVVVLFGLWVGGGVA